MAFSNGGGIRNDVVVEAGGAFTALDAADAFPFGNFLTIVEGITPERFKLLLEVAYRRLPGSSGSFAQVAGFTVEVDTSRQGLTFVDGSSPLEIDQMGQRIRRITLDDGTRIVDNYAPVGGAPSVNAATIDFLAQNGTDPVFGGDSYPLRDLPFTRLGVLYQQAVVDYLTDGLGGEITAESYPEGGAGRIRLIQNGVANEPGATLPARFALRGAFPNPTTGAARVGFDLPAQAEVTLAVYDVTGRLVAERNGGRGRGRRPAPGAPRRRPRAGPLRLPPPGGRRGRHARRHGQADGHPLRTSRAGRLNGCAPASALHDSTQGARPRPGSGQGGGACVAAAPIFSARPTTISMPRYLDLSQWPRRSTFEHFRPFSSPFFNVTAPVEVGPLVAVTRAAGLPFAAAATYLASPGRERHRALPVPARRRAGPRLRPGPRLAGRSSSKATSSPFATPTTRPPSPATART